MPGKYGNLTPLVILAFYPACFGVLLALNPRKTGFLAVKQYPFGLCKAIRLVIFAREGRVGIACIYPLQIWEM